MMLRDHPLLTRKSSICIWPPLWTTTRHDWDGKPTGEIGTLEQAFTHELLQNKMFLFIQFEGTRYLGCMRFDDERFCCELLNLLRSKVGCSIKEIGDIDLSHML